MTIKLSLSSPVRVSDVCPTHIGHEPIHANDVKANRARARKLWRMIQRKPCRFPS